MRVQPRPGTTLRMGLATAAVAMLSACAAVPSLGPPAAMKPAQAYVAQASFAAPTTSWPDDRWWTAYGDAQLNGLVEEALAASPDLAQARARVAKAEAQAGQAKAALLPSVTANGSYVSAKQSYNNGVPPAFTPHGYNDSARATIDFSWELDFFGKNRAALAAALSEAEASRAEAAEARLVLSTNVAAAYADLAQQFADRDAAENAVRIRGQTAELTAQRFANGLENRSASEQAQARLASARAELAAVDEQIGLTRNRLAALLGAGPDRGLAIARPKVGALKAFGLPANLQADLIGRRPEIVAARLRAEAASQRVKSAKAEFYPNVDLAAYFGQQSLGLDLFTKPGSQIGAIGPALSLPIFRGGALRANYRGAAADRDLAVASYDAAVARALQDVADAAVSSRALDARLGESRRALEASSSAYALALQRYRGGLATYLDVLTAQDAVIADQRTVGDLETRAFTLDVALVRALGGGFQAA
ncbi:MAG TPA: efflux transporter outer membrane subunit [Phenylobacterium sp.]|uniref:efflux transporter outer membrane subunit n=1 Tax=Phenylobacterium sp. TaxID=1871053 RepID=UPI002B4A6E4C|nr:efflux transporter outer membrane subunit [Phenylobacterium sp.]HKR88029.1 efflux transporter outer membrane subunit [Phenylobacterium sp.]